MPSTASPSLCFQNGSLIDDKDVISNGSCQRQAVGVFANHRNAEAALTDLRDSGFSIDLVSIIAEDMDAKDTEHRDNLAGVLENAS
ncbi:MAG TPA: hypothetical protein V6D29_07260 [Leptolyngbyaceae cyanobacterium]